LHQWRIFAPSIILTTQNPFEVRLAIEVGCVVASEILRVTWGKQTATVDQLYYFAEARSIKNEMPPYLRTLN